MAKKGNAWRGRRNWKARKRVKERQVILPQDGASARIAYNEVWAKLHSDDPGVVDATYRLLRFRPDGYRFMPRFKNGSWDGYMSLYGRRAGTFPGGLLDRAVARLRDLGVDVTTEDRSQVPHTEPLLADGTNLKELRPYQVEACDLAVEARRGVFNAATGVGKTEIMAEMIRRLGCRSLIIVASRDLAWQTIERFEGSEREPQTLSFPHAPVDALYGIVGDDTYKSGLVTAALFQTLVRRLMPVCLRCGGMGELTDKTCDKKKGARRCGGELDFTESDAVREWLATFDALHLDECHRATAKTWWPVVNAIPAYWRFGYSATPFKSDPITELKLVGATGDIFYSFPAKDAIEQGYLTKPFVVTVDPQFEYMHEDEDTTWMDSYRDGIVDHVKRCRVIAEIAKGTSEGWSVPTLIMVQWNEHGRNIKRALREIDVRAEFINGNATTAQRLKVLRAMADGRLNCVIATTIFDEGVNVPAIGALILAGGGKAQHKVIQRIGRGLRLVEGKKYLAVFDLWDSHGDKYLLGHSRQRLAAVKDAGFPHEKLTPSEVLVRIRAGDVRGTID